MSERPAYRQRVIEEKEALDEKLAALERFFETPGYDALPLADRHLLREQATHMFRYSAVLGARIARFDQ